GLMVVAKTIPAQTHLVEAMQAREITREYEAVCHGAMTGGGTIDEPIGRHPTKRTHMAVSQSGKPATTHFRVMEKYRAHTRSEEHTSELQSRENLVCRLLLEKKNKKKKRIK